jgi:hypothetical protein
MARRGDGLYRRKATWRAAALATLLVVLPVQAAAECAWVMWAWTPSETQADGPGVYSPVSGHKAISMCNDEKRMRETNPQLVPKGSRFICLPDTVDPRAPRGAGR